MANFQVIKIFYLSVIKTHLTSVQEPIHLTDSHTQSLFVYTPNFLSLEYAIPSPRSRGFKSEVLSDSVFYWLVRLSSTAVFISPKTK